MKTNKKTVAVEITLQGNREITGFHCVVSSIRYTAVIYGSKVSLLNEDYGSSADVLTAIKAIENEAGKYGYLKMEVYIDHFAQGFELLEHYVAEKAGLIEWVDRRYTRNEWTI